jgi:hypothetical protein
MKLLSEIRDTFLEALGLLLLSAAMEVLPKDASARTGALRGLKEQRAYDHYEGYRLMLSQQPLPFERWREQFQYLQIKMYQRDSASVREVAA